MTQNVITAEPASTERAPSEYPIYIYALIGDGELRYVGRTRNLKARLGHHCSEFARPVVREWVASLSGSPLIVPLYQVQPGEDPYATERRFILMLSTAAKLLNAKPADVQIREALPNEWAQKLVATGLSQAEISRRFGVSRSTVCRWFRGEISPSRKRARQLLEMVGA